MIWTHLFYILAQHVFASASIYLTNLRGVNGFNRRKGQGRKFFLPFIDMIVR